MYIPTQTISFPRGLFYTPATNFSFVYGWNGGSNWRLGLTANGMTYCDVDFASPLNQNTWYFVSVSYNGSSVYIGLDGVVTSFSGRTISATGSGLTFGLNTITDSNANSFGPHYLADVSVITGTALYTSNFTKPTTHPSVASGQRLLLLTKTSTTFLYDEVSAANVSYVTASPTYYSGNPIGASGNIISYANITASYFIGNGSQLTNITGANVSGTVANATYSTTTGTVTTAAQPNITSVGTLTTVSVSGNVSSGGNIIGNGQYLTSITGGNVTGQVGNALVAGTVYTAAQPNITSVGTLTSVNVSGNVSSGGNIIGNGQYLTSITGANVNGAVTFATTANSVAGGNVSGQVANALIAGTVYTNAQPNITSVGTLTSLSVTSNVSAGNILTDNLLYANGTAWSFGGTGSGNIAVDTFTGDGANTAFTLSVTPTSANNVIVNYNGAFVTHDSYSVAGATLTFGSAPATGSKVEVTTLQGVPSGGGGGASNTSIRAQAMTMGIIFGG